MSASDCAFIFEMFGVEVRETPLLRAEPAGFLIRRPPGLRSLILTRDAAPLAKHWTRVATQGPEAAVMRLVIKDKPLPEHGRR